MAKLYVTITFFPCRNFHQEVQYGYQLSEKHQGTLKRILTEPESIMT